MDMEIRKAAAADIPRIVELYDAAKAALRGLGIDQWQDGYPNGDSALQDIQEGIGHVLVENGTILATAAVYVGHEPTYDVIFDGAWKTENKAYGIIHRIAVSPEAKNKGAASFIMDHCAGLARAAGVSSLRCDTHSGNVVMRHTLEKNGYLHCGTILLESGASRVAYEKIL